MLINALTNHCNHAMTFKLMPNLHTWNVSFNFLLHSPFKVYHPQSLPPPPPLAASHLYCVCMMVPWSFSSAQTGEKGYRRLTPDQPVGLRHAHCYLTLENVIKVFQYYTTPPIIMNNFVQNSDGGVVELHCHYHPHDSSNKPKSYIHWVSDPAQCTVRLYDKL